ncbi:MAG: YigZ family protein [Gemmatimonadota bacterium]
MPEAPDGYPVPAGRCRRELEAQRSRFIATLGPAATPEEARALLDDVAQEFPDATHHCWAFVAGSPGSTTHIGMSDDGEPHGTAGRPILEVLLHSGIGEVAAVVTRYYGGTNLGKGGLARAYGGAASAALEEIPTVRKVERVAFRLRLEYAWLDPFRREVEDAGGELTDEAFGEHVDLTLRVPISSVQRLRDALARMSGGAAGEWTALEPS